MTTLLEPALLGAQRPRVHSGPKFLTSAGQEATALAASFGLVLDPWQAWVLEQSLGERADGRWASPEVGLLVPRQNGKGSILEARELAGLFLFGEKQITHSAHEAKTAKDHFVRMESLLRNSGYDDDKVTFRRSTTEVSIYVHATKCKLYFYTRTDNGGRGLGGDVVVLDEAYALTQDQMAALMPTMAARSLRGNTQMWFTSSAGFPDSDVLNTVRESGEKQTNSRLAYFDWSADPGSAYDDRAGWAQANPGLGVRISEDYIASELPYLGEERFGRERLGLWADAASAVVIPPDVWNAVADADSHRVGSVVFAVDAEVDRSAASISVAGVNQYGKTHVELIDKRQGVTWAAERLIELHRKYHPESIVLDGVGPAASLIPALQAAGIEPVVTSADHMKRACGGFYDAVVDRSLAHTGLEPRLDASVAQGAKRPLGDAWAWRKRGRGELSPLVSVTLAHYGLATVSARPTTGGWMVGL